MEKKLPVKFIEGIKERWSTDYSDFLDAIQSSPHISMRRHPIKGKNISFEGMEKIPWAEEGYYLATRPSYVGDPLYHAGCYYAQEASSMLFANFLKNLPSGIIALDLCAAPGGKSSLLQSILTPDSILVSNELVGKRNIVLQENLFKWGADNTFITCNKAEQFLTIPNSFDVIILDAPCSGEGMFRKDDEAISQWSPNLVDQCAGIQSGLLKIALELIKDDGIIIYSTCTFEAIENEWNVSKAIKDSKYSITGLELPNYQNYGLEKVEVIENELNGYYALPHKTRGEGLFVSAFRVSKKENSKRKSIKPITSITTRSKIVNDITKLITDKGFTLYETKEVIHGMTDEQTSLFNLMSSNGLTITKKGLHVFDKVQNNVLPHQHLANQYIIDLPYPTIELSKEDALNYLRGETLSNLQEINNQIVTLTYLNTPIGFGKVLPNRINNLYPKDWRIRKKF